MGEGWHRFGGCCHLVGLCVEAKRKACLFSYFQSPTQHVDVEVLRGLMVALWMTIYVDVISHHFVEDIYNSFFDELGVRYAGLGLVD